MQLRMKGDVTYLAGEATEYTDIQFKWNQLVGGLVDHVRGYPDRLSYWRGISLIQRCLYLIYPAGCVRFLSVFFF